MKEKLFLAPIAGYTNRAFRELCKKYGADFTFIAFKNARGIISSDKLIKEIDCENEKNVGIQLFGSFPEDFKKATKLINDKFDNISCLDINSGCPAPKITKIKAGARLVKNPCLLKEIIKATKEFNGIRSVKIRILKNKKESLKLIEEISSLVDRLCIHPRTEEQAYSGYADWSVIKEAKEIASCPIIGNGDIKSKKEAIHKISKGYCDAVMIAREAMKNPAVFSDKDIKKTKLLKEYLHLCNKYDSLSINDLKQKAIHLLYSEKYAKEHRIKIGTIKNLEEIIKYIEELD